MLIYRIDLNRLVANAAVLAGTLPCIYFARDEDVELNQILYASLQMAVELTGDKKLQARLQRLCMMLQESVRPIELSRTLLISVGKRINRLEEHYKPALRLIRLLFEGQGLSLDGHESSLPLHGFFFNMNSFFQDLLSKLLGEYLEGFTIRDEYTLHESFAFVSGLNPRGRHAPKPRPDFAVVKRNRVVILLDAKYKDLWEYPLPSNWLYQMTVYATSGAGNGTARILYPSVLKSAGLQAIDVRNPATGARVARVVLQPVNLVWLAELLAQPSGNHYQINQYVNELVFG